jgi:hypothetical protein
MVWMESVRRALPQVLLPTAVLGSVVSAAIVVMWALFAMPLPSALVPVTVGTVVLGQIAREASRRLASEYAYYTTASKIRHSKAWDGRWQRVQLSSSSKAQ